MSISFQGTLAQNLEFGHMLEICAKAQRDGKWFNIILAAKSHENDTYKAVGLQILVYLNVNKIAFKTTDNERQEEIKEGFPTEIFFEHFKINIVMTEDNFNVAINEKPCTQIPYDLAINKLNNIRIIGDLEYIKQMDHRKYFPYTWPPMHLSDKRTDFSNDQHMSFEPGHVMVINAQLHGNSHGRLLVQIKNSRDNVREELHISARFGEKKFIRNSKTVTHTDKHTGISYINYGTEETSGGWPFKDFSSPFNLAIAFTETEFLIAKDGKFLYRFGYRTKNVLPDLVGVKIWGHDGTTVQVNRIDHIKMADPECVGFEKYSRLIKQ